MGDINGVGPETRGERRERLTHDHICRRIQTLATSISGMAMAMKAIPDRPEYQGYIHDLAALVVRQGRRIGWLEKSTDPDWKAWDSSASASKGG